MVVLRLLDRPRVLKASILRASGSWAGRADPSRDPSSAPAAEKTDSGQAIHHPLPPPPPPFHHPPRFSPLLCLTPPGTPPISSCLVKVPEGVTAGQEIQVILLASLLRVHCSPCPSTAPPPSAFPAASPLSNPLPLSPPQPLLPPPPPSQSLPRHQGFAPSGMKFKCYVPSSAVGSLLRHQVGGLTCPTAGGTIFVMLPEQQHSTECATGGQLSVVIPPDAKPGQRLQARLATACSSGHFPPARLWPPTVPPSSSKCPTKSPPSTQSSSLFLQSAHLLLSSSTR
eukprot:499238-Hanusia_phi.AAC.1